MIKDIESFICKERKSWERITHLGDECSPDTSLDVLEEFCEISFVAKTKSGKYIRYIVNNHELPLTYVDEKQGNHETTLSKIAEFVKQKYNADFFTLEFNSAYYGFILSCEDKKWILYGITRGYA